MKILFTGGGTGGHFFPIVAVIESLRKIAEEKNFIDLDIVFMSDTKYDDEIIFQNKIRFRKIDSGKIRNYFSVRNFFDVFKTAWGCLKAFWVVYSEFPDVIFSKGGYVSFPVVLSAKLLRIPLIIHESDTVPGKVNKFSAGFAKRIAIAFPEAIQYFDKTKTALVGNPIRKEFFYPLKGGAKEFLKLEDNVPVIFIMGGSQGAQKINDIIVDDLPRLLENYQIIHQCGKNNYEDIKGRAGVMMENSRFKSRYHLFDFLNLDALRMVYSVSNLVISRAGAGSIFEIAIAGLPSILIPITNSAQDHQRKNAYAYAGTGAADVIEEGNLSSSIVFSEVSRLLANKERLEKMGVSAKAFVKTDASEKIANEIINLVLEHTPQ